MKKLKELRTAKGLTQAKLAEKLNLSRSTIAMYETEQSEPDVNTLKAMATFFGVSLDYLLEQDEETKVCKIPIVGTIPAGIPLEAIEEIIDYEEISPELQRSGKYIGLKVKGESMEPLINDGDVVILKQCSEANSGDIVAVYVNGYDATLKRLKLEDNGLWLLPENPNSNFKPQFYSKKDVETIPIKIIGKAIEVRRKL